MSLWRLVSGIVVMWGALAQAAPVDVPFVESAPVDGAGGWSDRATQVALFNGLIGGMPLPSDLDPKLAVAWTNEGLRLYIQVRDDVRDVAVDGKLPWEKDSIEIFVSKPKADGFYQALVQPAETSSAAPLNVRFFGPRRATPAQEYAVTAVGASRVTGLGDGGYTADILLPWSNLGTPPKEGDLISVQVVVNDADQQPGRVQMGWNSRPRTAEDTSAMQQVRLGGPQSRQSSETIVRADYDAFARLRVDVTATGRFEGRRVELRRGDAVLAADTLRPFRGRTARTLYVSLPPPGEDFAGLTVWADGAAVAEPELQPAELVRTRTVTALEFDFKPYVFRGTVLPEGDFANALLARQLLGAYTVQTTYYDKDYHVVQAAATPGRYGAVVEITPENGRPMKRFRTLFRIPDGRTGFGYTFWQSDGTLKLPEELELDPTVVQYQAESVGWYANRLFQDAMNRDAGAAVLLAGLSETPAATGRADAADNARALDRQWWVGLKRKLYGTEKGEPFVCPKPIEGPPAPTVREGTAQEAGMKPESIGKIDAVCREWAEASGEPFGVCLVRHGVAFFHRAYGDYHGRPMDTTTRTWMASISKLLGGTQMMMLVDQGLVELDTPVDAYLPVLRGIEVAKPLTIRHLFTHTNGLRLGLTMRGFFPDHWGDEFNDFEELVAWAYPNLKVGEALEYNGAGYALAGKIIEQITGEAQPVYAKRHLLEPLGCRNTDIVDMSAYSRSVPMDMARIGQMLLNKGAYGDMRFFSEATFERMLPVKLTGILGPDTEVEWGIGPVKVNAPGFSAKTFGHGAASAATFFIDPENDLVVVMTRDSGGPRFAEFHPRFCAAIVEGIE